MGISFGADRIYDVMVGLDLFPAEIGCSTKVLFTNLGEAEAMAALKCVNSLRGAGISAEIYPDAAKMKKQMEYANRRAIPYVAIIGSNELEQGVVTLKNMTSGEQTTVAMADIANHIA